MSTKSHCPIQLSWKMWSKLSLGVLEEMVSTPTMTTGNLNLQIKSDLPRRLLRENCVDLSSSQLVPWLIVLKMLHQRVVLMFWIVRWVSMNLSKSFESPKRRCARTTTDTCTQNLQSHSQPQSCRCRVSNLKTTSNASNKCSQSCKCDTTLRPTTQTHGRRLSQLAET